MEISNVLQWLLAKRGLMPFVTVILCEQPTWVLFLEAIFDGYLVNKLFKQHNKKGHMSGSLLYIFP